MNHRRSEQTLTSITRKEWLSSKTILGPHTARIAKHQSLKKKSLTSRPVSFNVLSLRQVYSKLQRTNFFSAYYSSKKCLVTQLDTALPWRIELFLRGKRWSMN
jgi:hypothetical protein